MTAAARRRLTLRERNALFVASGAVCAGCGQPLDHTFHADHRIPWSVSRRTCVHEMQALCPLCNLRKGNKMLRAHQDAVQRISLEPQCGASIRWLIAAVTPGGGKSALPVILARNLIGFSNPRGRGQRADAICWVTPRDSLRVQGEYAFSDPDIRALLPHSLTIRAAGNDCDPCRDCAGYVTTYQAIGSQPDLHAQEFGRRRYILVLDEPHHVEDGSLWHRALQPLVDQAVLVVLMSGTFERGDGKKIAFMPYRLRDDGRQEIDLTPNETTEVVCYSRRDALQEKAILPLYFDHLDGEAEWIDRDGINRRVDSLATSGQDAPAALFTALRSSYAEQLLKESVKDWNEYREQNPRSKLLVIAPNIPLAKRYLSWLHGMGVTLCDIATSNDSKTALDNIKRFRAKEGTHLPGPELMALVTVGMAYEGLDVPALTHTACLTHIRSRPYLEQLLARATRVDRRAGPYETQAGYVRHPDDPLFAEAIAQIKAEQAAVVREPLKDAGGGGGEGEGCIVPLGAQATAHRASDMQTGEVIDAGEYQRLRGAMSAAGIKGYSVSQFKSAMAAYQARHGQQTAPVSPLVMTPSEQERALRLEIDRKIKQSMEGDPDMIKAVNIMLKRHFKKPRDAMTVAELQEMWAMIQSDLLDGWVA